MVGLRFTTPTLHCSLDPRSSRKNLLLYPNIIWLSPDFIGIQRDLWGYFTWKVSMGGDTLSAKPHASDLLPILDGCGGRVPRHRARPVFRVKRLRLVASARRRPQLAWDVVRVERDVGKSASGQYWSLTLYIYTIYKYIYKYIFMCINIYIYKHIFMCKYIYI